MKYWLITILSVTSILFMLSCTESLTGKDDNNGNDSIIDTTDTNVVDTSDTVPTAPTNVSATKGSSSVYIDVTWSPVLGQGVNRYIVYRSDYPDNLNDKSYYSKMKEADTSDSVFMSGFYRDTIAYQGKMTYYYRVVAFNYYGEGEWSDPDSGWINYVDPNDTIPQQFDIYFNSQVNQTNNSISIIWYPENDDTSSIINVYKSIGDTLSWALLASDADTPFVDSSTKLPGTTYYYALTATPEGGVEGLKSTYMKLTTAPLGPDSVWITETTESSLSIAWNSVEGASSYGIFLSGGYNPDYSTTDTTYTISALMSGVTTYLTVDALVGTIRSEKSDTISGRTYYTGPYWLTVSNDQDQFISVTWPKLQTYTDTIEGATYTLYKGSDSTNMVILDSTLTTTSYIDSNVIVDSMYYYKVSAVDSLGWPSSFSPTKSGKAIKNITVFAPDSLWKLSGEYSGIILHWTSGEGATGYKLYRKSTYDSNDDWHLIASPADTTYHDTNTIDWLGYAYAVSSTNDSGEESSKYTNTFSFVSFGDYSHIDINITVDSSSSDMIRVKWNKTSNGTEEKYVVYRQENSEMTTIVDVLDSSVTSWTDTNVVSGNNMEYTVDPVFDIGGIKYKVGGINAGLNANTIEVTVP